jgi:hypothetical protein
MTKLCPRGKAAAKRKFAVYPSAYANAYASKICAGKIKDPSGTKRKDFKGPKPAAKGAMMNKPKGAVFGFLFRKKKKEKEADSKETKESLIKKNVGKKNKRLKELKDEIGMTKGGGADTGRVGEIKSKFAVATGRKAPGRRLTSKDLERLKKLKPMKPLSRITGGPADPNNPGTTDTQALLRDKDGKVIRRTIPGNRKYYERKLKKQAPFQPDPVRKQDPAPRPGRKKKQYRPRPAGRPLAPPPPNRPSKPQYISRATGGMADYYKDLM